MTAALGLLTLQRQRPGTLAVLIAATCLLMLLAAAGVLALRTTGHAVARAGAERVIVQVVEADPARRETAAGAVLDRLGRMPGLRAARRVPDAEARALVAPYIAGVSGDPLPLPALIEVRAARPALVGRALAGLPAVQVSDVGAELGPLLRLIAALRAVGLGVALAAAAATGLIAILSARAALARESGTLAVLHGLGATDGQLSRLVTGKIARDAAIGAAIGFAAAATITLSVGARLTAAGAGIDTGLGLAGWAILAGLALALVALATAAAQGALLASLRRAP